MLRATFAAAKWLATEMFIPAAEKLIPQGGAEFMQAMYNGQGYTPYGPTQAEVPMPDDNDRRDKNDRLLDPPAPIVGTKSKGIDRD